MKDIEYGWIDKHNNKHNIVNEEYANNSYCNLQMKL